MATNAPANVPDSEEVEAGGRTLFTPRINIRNAATFCRQLAVLLDAGIPMVRSLKILGRRTSGGGMKNLLASVTTDVEAGGAFSTALQTHGAGLPGIVVPLTRAGEKSGELSKNLRYLADSLDNDAHIRSKVSNALIFPVVTFGVATVVLLFILTQVAPKFKDLLMAANGDTLPDMPWLSRSVFAASDVASSPTGLLVIVVALAALVFLAWRSLTHKSYLMDFLKIRLPYIGGMVTTAAMARFSKTLSALLRTGVPVLESLRLSRETVDNMAIETAIVAMEKSVENGGRMSAPLEEYWYVPELARDMIVIGEESGSMAEMLENASEVFRAQVDQDQERLVSLIEPVMTLILGGLVLMVVLAIFMPYISIIQNSGAM
ncbi:MAG: type II secretion system F family protein [Proteobacteria bacterium]|nr:type II secretion system F family protein [Pseudomonadota bacterium]